MHSARGAEGPGAIGEHGAGRHGPGGRPGHRHLDGQGSGQEQSGDLRTLHRCQVDRCRSESWLLHVLRRHRLAELFLVKVIGLDWSEVHDEAELLEHAVSDRIIERMEEILGFPDVDPHGDPIPSAGGEVAEPELMNLLLCPLEKSFRVARVIDQNPGVPAAGRTRRSQAGQPPRGPVDEASRPIRSWCVAGTGRN